MTRQDRIALFGSIIGLGVGLAGLIIALFTVMQNDIARVEARLGAVEARLGAVETRLGAVEARVRQLEAGQNAIVERMARFEGTLATVIAFADIGRLVGEPDPDDNL